MNGRMVCWLALAAFALAGCATPTSYSTGAVSNYPANPCFGPNLALSVGSAASFRSWYARAGLPNVSRWENNDVWGSDFRDGPGADLDSRRRLPSTGHRCRTRGAKDCSLAASSHSFACSARPSRTNTRSLSRPVWPM